MEWRRQRDIETAEERRQSEILQQCADRYSSRFETLDQLRSDVARHRDLADTVARLSDAVGLRDPDDDAPASRELNFKSVEQSALFVAHPFQPIFSTSDLEPTQTTTNLTNQPRLSEYETY